ncbi:hypothetical protein AMTRI_Chr06g169710 [Amborella trichopoda]
MELHSPAMAKRLWNLLRLAFFMVRKGLISKRKLVMDMNLMTKRGKLLGKSLQNLVFHHHPSSESTRAFGLQDYEFSCSNSPAIFSHVSKRRHHFPSFPCIHSHVLDEEPRAIVITLPKFSPENRLKSPGNFLNSPEYSIGLPEYSPGMTPLVMASPEYPPENEDSGHVDAEAEEFIKRFYEELRVQSRTARLEYREMEYREMLVRSAS